MGTIRATTLRKVSEGELKRSLAEQAKDIFGELECALDSVDE